MNKEIKTNLRYCSTSLRILNILFITGVIFCLNSCATTSEPTTPNILLICIDDLRPELNSFGANHIYSPNIDQLASEGFSFRRHYVNAPSCGPSRYTLLTGLYGPPENNALFLRSQQMSQDSVNIHPSMPEWFRQHGYTTVSIGKVSHHPGGWGGEDWNDSTSIEMPGAWDRQLMPVGPWQHPRGAMHGLANGEIRNVPKEMDVYQSKEGADDIYPDGLITREALHQIEKLTSDQSEPFFLAVGLIRPHLPFGSPKQYLDQYEGVEFPEIPHPEKPQGISTWHNSNEFRQYNLWGKDPNQDDAFAEALRRHYAACVSYADAQVGEILEALNKSGADENTIVVVWGDHGWHLGEHAIWGKHSLYEEALRSPLIIKTPEADSKGKVTNAIVETMDVFPTLCDLAAIEKPDYTEGQSFLSLLNNPEKEGHPAIAYKRGAATVRSGSHRLTLHQDGSMELYDHNADDGETSNIANVKPTLADSLKLILLDRLSNSPLIFPESSK